MRSHCVVLVLLMLSSCSRGAIDEAASGPALDLPLQTAGDQADGSGSSEFDAALSTAADAILAAVNVRRALAGIPPLIQQAELTDIAGRRSGAMAVGGYLGHVDPQSGELAVELLLRQGGFSGQVAELLYNSQGTLSTLADEGVEAWFMDPDHRQILLSPDFRYSGVGIMGDGQVWIITLVVTGDLP